MQPKPRRAHVQKHEKRFKIRRHTDRRGCSGCYDPSEFGSVRARRTAALKTGHFDDVPLFRWARDVMHWHNNGAKHNLHAHGTRMRLTYRVASRRKRRNQM